MMIMFKIYLKIFIVSFSFANALISTKFRGSNRLFLDTANLPDWNDLLPLGIFHGVTTNPSILEKAGHVCNIDTVRGLANQALSTKGCNEFMCQAWGSTSDEMYNVGMALSEPDRENIVIKVPVTLEGTKAASKLIDSGVRVCLTACYSSTQAIVAAGLGAEYIAPYLGRMNDNEKNGMWECTEMQRIAGGMGSNVRILVASIRDVDSMADLCAAGMDTFTFSPEVARALFTDQLTNQAAEEFEAAAIRCGAERC